MENNQTPKRGAIEILKDAGHQIFVSAIFLVVGFVIINWGSLYELGKYKWETFTGENMDTPLHELVNETTDKNSDTKSEESREQVTSNPQKHKYQIPDLDIEIAPTDNRIIIPRINKNIPIVRISSETLVRRDWKALEKEMQGALQNGVVHYPGTSLPGQSGNIAITGHSSYFPWDSGRFKDVFALLHEVVEGDKIVIYYDQKKYLYEISEIKVVLPDDIEVLKQTPDDRLTLVTCTPIGTNLKRLIVVAKPIKAEIVSDGGGILR